ncbi:MAG: serine/threonine protein kinase [Labilithrix sp.]|nr:serine/threonine protein kinase [Labilithrix sp.]
MVALARAMHCRFGVTPRAREPLELPDPSAYRLLMPLGRGGMAEVHLALARRSVGAPALVAIKRLRPSFASNEEYREMFRNEARIAVHLDHPNIVRAYESFEDDEGTVIVMEYLEGQPLAHVLRAAGDAGRTLSPWASVRIVRDLLAALHHAHELCAPDGTPLSIIHRDVSPQNVFVTYRGEVKLLDFGIAKASGGTARTRPGWMKGKFGYMAPEQFRANEEHRSIDRRVDVFTAGIVLWEMVTGRSLFGGGSEGEIIRAILHAPIPRPSSMVGGVDPGLDVVLARALQRDPERRFPSALAMHDALGVVLERLSRPRYDLGHVVGRLFQEDRLERERLVGEALGESSTLARGAAARVHDAALPTPTAIPLPTPMTPVAVRRPRVRGLRVFAGFALVVATMLATRWLLLRASDAPSPPAPREVSFAREPPPPVASPEPVPSAEPSASAPRIDRGEAPGKPRGRAPRR